MSSGTGPMASSGAPAGSSGTTAAAPAPAMAAERPASHLYYVRVWHGPVGTGVSGTRYVELFGYAKVSEPDDNPYVVVNELVAARIGALIGLPVPPGMLIPTPAPAIGAGWVTMSFLNAPGALPPVNAGKAVAALPNVAAGVVVFDILIANSDRHGGNLALTAGPVLAAGGPAPGDRLEVFDHSHALVRFGHPTVADYLSSITDKLVIDGALLPESNRCVLLDHVASVQGILAWCQRLRTILSDAAIDEICEEAAMVTPAFTSTDAAALADFLKHRRDTIEDLARAAKDEFKAIPNADWTTS